MKKVATTNAPAAIGPYSQGIIVDNFLFTSGQIGLRADGTLVGDDIISQTKQVLKNLEAILKEAGATYKDVVKTTIFLDDINDFKVVNEIYEEFFKEHKPARSTVAVKTLPLNVKIEIELIAKVPKKD